jgi:hypothetical protein
MIIPALPSRRYQSKVLYLLNRRIMIIDPTTERSLEIPPRSVPTETDWIYRLESIGLNTNFSQRNLGNDLEGMRLCQSAGVFFTW